MTTTHQDLATQAWKLCKRLTDYDVCDGDIKDAIELLLECAAALEAASQPPGAVERHQLAVNALEAAKNGLEWYRDRCPEAVDGSDDEMDAQIDEAIAALSAPSPAQAPVVQGEINYLEEIYGFLCSTAPEGYADEAFRIVPNSLLADSVRDRIAGSRPSVGTDSGPVSGHAESSSSPDGRDGASVVSTTQAAEPLSHTDLNAAIVADWLADHDHLEEADKVRRIHGIGVKGATYWLDRLEEGGWRVFQKAEESDQR